jgi:phage terminase small subunit
MPVLENAKHEAVAQVYIADPAKIGWRAYKAVYPKSSRRAAETQFSRLLKNVEFSARIAEMNEQAAEGAVATARQTLEELTKIGLANMQDYVGEDFAVREISTLSRDQAAALAEITVETFMDGRGNKAREVRRVKFKLADKLAALGHLGRHHKLFTDRHEHTARPLSPVAPVINLYGRPEPGEEYADAAR